MDYAGDREALTILRNNGVLIAPEDPRSATAIAEALGYMSSLTSASLELISDPVDDTSESS